MYTIHIVAEIPNSKGRTGTYEWADEVAHRVGLAAEQYGAEVVTAVAYPGEAPRSLWRIVSVWERDHDGQPLYWNNIVGWVSRGFSVYDYADIGRYQDRVPDGGAWVPY